MGQQGQAPVSRLGKGLSATIGDLIELHQNKGDAKNGPAPEGSHEDARARLKEGCACAHVSVCDQGVPEREEVVSGNLQRQEGWGSRVRS